MKTNRVVGCPNLILFIVGSLLFLTPIACNTYSPGGGGGNAPYISALTPASGPVGSSVTITGNYFGASQGSSTIKFNGTAATPTSWSGTSIVVSVPPGATTGSVVVTVNGVASNGVSFTVTSTPGPSIASLNPTFGPVGTSVTITGTNFGASQGSSTVTFNGTPATPTSWSGTSIVVPVPAGATTGNVVVTVGGVASNGANFNVTTSSGKFPIKASANNRYFVDATGAPWMMVADAAHHMMPAIPQSAVAAYLTDRVGHGFNAIDFYFMCAGAGTCPASGAAFDHTLPFTSGSGPSTYDLSTPTPAYWAEVDSVISQAAADGLVVFVNPIPWGVAFSSTLQNNGAMKDFNFGAFLGNRYKNSPNIIWHVGQDFQSWNSSSSDLNDEAQLMAGIRSADPNHLLMSQLSYPGSYSSQANSLNATFAANLTANFVYSYRETYDEVLQAYNSSPTLPAVLGEANYETGNNLGGLSSAASAYTTREEMWWTMTSGATGHAFGNEHVNHFDSVYTSNLDTTATSQVHYLTDLFATRSWWTFAPDQAHAVVTAGYGTYNGSNENLYSGTYATTTWDGGTTSITYTPVSTTLTVDMSKFSKLMNASWYDPTTGASTTITGSPFANSGTQTFTTPPAAHADGTHDWVLVLQ